MQPIRGGNSFPQEVWYPFLTKLEMAPYLRCLPPKQRFAMILRYGFHPKYPEGLTFKEIGDRQNLSGERIRQIINKSLRILRRKIADGIVPNEWLCYHCSAPEGKANVCLVREYQKEVS